MVSSFGNMYNTKLNKLCKHNSMHHMMMQVHKIYSHSKEERHPLNLRAYSKINRKYGGGVGTIKKESNWSQDEGKVISICLGYVGTVVHA